jgi:Flp pilus assembly protein TadD
LTPATGELTAWREPSKELVNRDLGLALFETAAGDKKNDEIVRSYQLLKSLPLEQRVDPDVMAALASVLFAQNQKEFAQKLYAGAETERPQNARFAYCLGVVYAAEGNTAQAVAQFRRSIAIDPSDPEPYRKLAALYRAAGQPGQAKAVQREYLDFMPQNLFFRHLVEQHP